MSSSVHKKREQESNHDSDAFLSSMTFASGGLERNCDCDECDFIPAPIAEAIRQHKRMRTTLTRMQDRTLVARVGTITMWKQTMPVDAEPLIEFGNSHRIVLVHSLSSRSSLTSIGKGVVGSSDETKGRRKLPWKEGLACLLPQNGGLGLGFVHTKDDNAEEPVGHAIMYSIKIPIEALDKKQDEASDSPEWVRTVVNICRENLNDSPTATNDNDCTSKGMVQDSSIPLRKDEADRLRILIKELQENEKAY